MKVIKQVRFFCFLLCGFFLYTSTANAQIADFFSDRVIVKILPEYRHICTENKIDTLLFETFYDQIGGEMLAKKFPQHQEPSVKVNHNELPLVDLSLIYEFRFSQKIPLRKILQKLNAMHLFEYAEPHYIQHLCYTPNDSLIASQYAIQKIKADAAWGVNTTTARGDTNVVIGIVDTGYDFEHPDLKDQVKYNYADPIDGVDNDNDGYVDNFKGWNFGENSNDPTYYSNTHGVHVSGISAAKTDNVIGIAGIGFNCKLLPINIADTDGVLVHSYSGIVYAADHGCNIINCSWGGSGAGQFGQDIITYATINKNALVVAAAGNNSNSADFFPANYDYVISVANTNSNDSITKESNYGYYIDVCAPGQKIVSTFPDSSGYKELSGTSMASPCVAGAAAIVKSFYPNYTAIQIGEQLKTTADDIYGINDIEYKDKLGSGRINLYQALTQTGSPSIVMSSKSITDKKENLFLENDTAYITADFTNYLSPTVNLTITLLSLSEYVEVVDGVLNVGSINTLETVNNVANPFTFRILPDSPDHERVQFKITYSDTASAYTHDEYFTWVINEGYINININEVAISVTDNGKIGYYEDAQKRGIGFTYHDSASLIYEAGLMLGTNGTQLSDAVRGGDHFIDNDFRSYEPARKVLPSVYSEMDVEAVFTDENAYYPLPVKIRQSAYAWSTEGNEKYIIIRYKIYNEGTENLINLYAGVFVDWDIDALTYDENRILFDTQNKLAYVFYTGDTSVYAGVKLLSNSAAAVHYAIDNVPGGKGGIDLTDDGFTGNEKYLALSTTRNSAGMDGSGNDVIDVLSSGPFILIPDDSIEVAFAFIAGDNLSDLQESAQNAQLKYDEIKNILADENSPITLFPNPTSGKTNLDFFVDEVSNVELNIYNLLGEKMANMNYSTMQPGAHRLTINLGYLEQGCYILELIVGDVQHLKKIVVAN